MKIQPAAEPELQTEFNYLFESASWQVPESYKIEGIWGQIGLCRFEGKEGPR
jgi:hypothetical protein